MSTLNNYLKKPPKILSLTTKITTNHWIQQIKGLKVPGDTLVMEDFYAAAYSETPAHSDDIHEMIIENPDMEVITEAGGQRRKPNTIKATDILKLTSQRSMFFMFPNFSDKN